MVRWLASASLASQLRMICDAGLGAGARVRRQRDGGV